MRRGSPEPVPRIGCVPYLNARPLIEGLEYPVVESVPSRLFEVFQEGMLDAALLSSIDVLKSLGGEVVDGVSISARGDVQSVVLAYTGELERIEEIQLDPASHTSNALLQIILGEFHGLKTDYVQIQERKSIDLPALLIGDPALSLRKRTSHKGIKFLDLGGEWYRSTGLPFVFAMWALKKEFTNKSLIPDTLRVAKTRGLARIDQIAAKTDDPAFSKAYLRHSIRYELGVEEKQGLALFGSYLRRLGLIQGEVKSLEYI